MKNILLILLLFLSLKGMAQLTKDEKYLINEMDNKTPFRVLKITNSADSVFLRTPAQNIDLLKDQKEIKKLVDRMKITMDAESGVGIAAPQIGISRNIFLFTKINDPQHPVIVALNPKIIDHPIETVCFERDGCLSIPGVSGNSIRYPWVEVEYTNENGELVREKLEGYSRQEDFTGVIFQHEYDHLQGVLFIDKLCTENP